MSVTTYNTHPVGLPAFQAGQKVRCIHLDVRADSYMRTYEPSRTVHRRIGVIGILLESYGNSGNGLGELYLVRLELPSGEKTFCFFYQSENSPNHFFTYLADSQL